MPCSVVLIVVMYWPAAQVVCAEHVVPSSQYPELHEAHFGLSWVGQSVPVAPDPLAHVHSFKLH